MLQIKELISQLTANKPLYYAFLSFIVILFGILEIWVIQGKRKKDIKKIKQVFKQEEPTVKAPKTKEQEQANLELQKVIAQMEKDLEKKNENTIRNFEEQQEENAIISYQELLEHTKSLKQSEISQIKENAEPQRTIVPQTLERTPLKQEEPNFLLEEEEDDFEQMTGQKNAKFKSTEFISPIYGRMKEEPSRESKPIISRSERPISLREIRNQRKATWESTPVYDASQLELTRSHSLEEENMRSDEFLQSLKEFRKNL